MVGVVDVDGVRPIGRILRLLCVVGVQPIARISRSLGLLIFIFNLAGVDVSTVVNPIINASDGSFQ